MCSNSARASLVFSKEGVEDGYDSHWYGCSGTLDALGNWFGEFGKTTDTGTELEMVEMLHKVDDFCLHGSDKLVAWSTSLEARR